MIYRTLQIMFSLNNNSEYEIQKIRINSKNGCTTTFNDTKLLVKSIDKIKEDTTFYVNDLDKFYIYLITELLKSSYYSVDKINKQKTFSYVYKSGVCSNVKLKNINMNNIYFVNFKRKFGIDFLDNGKNFELIDYALTNNRKAQSLGSDAFNEFIKTILPPSRYLDFVAHQIIRNEDHFPIFQNSEEILDAKENVSGYQYCKSGSYTNVYEYDISSSYPAQLLCDTPKGLPIVYEKLQDVPRTYFKIITFTYFNAKCKKSKIDFLNLSNLGCLSLTQNLFELFKENYTANIKITQITAFKTQKSPFKKFITKNIINGKELEERKHIAKYNKFIGNSIIGYFGRNTTTISNTATRSIVDGNTSQSTETKNIDPIYLPVYLCVLDRAKSQFIRTLQKQKNIIYANTDGFLTTTPIDLDLLNFENSLPVGNYKLKNCYSKLYIDCINGYAGITTAGEIKNTLAGMTLDGLIEPETYRNRTFSYYVNQPTERGTIKQIKIQPHQ